MNKSLVNALLIVMLRAVIQVDGPIPTVTADISISGSHFEHTVAADGSFKHPFEQVDPKVQTIHYEGSQTISKRMHRAASARKHHAAAILGQKRLMTLL